MRLLLALLIVLAAGCGVRVPEIPSSARAQTPRAAPAVPWFAPGRMELVLPGKRVSCTAYVRGLGNGQARLVLLSDEGLQLLDLQSTDDGYQVIQAIDDLKKAVPHLGRLLRQAFALPPEKRRWEDDRIAAASGGSTRWYGGDPVLLRAIEGDGLDIAIEDYQPLGGELLAHEARATAPFGITMRIHLGDARLLPPTPAVPAEPAEPR
ncbi:MAG: hypothetical protein H0W83_14620 [Planctomycetes bacterium]|nr:hypothetical protein [Planctomycetota bacterium]